MCGCGRKRVTDVMTSAQAQEEQYQRADAMARLEAQTASDAEAYVKSASNAISNSSSQ